MTKLKDLTNIKFTKLTVIKRDYERNGAFWICKCECGNQKSINASSLIQGTTKSCGCIRSSIVDLTGVTNNELTVISFLKITKGASYWNCKCSCGNTTVVRGTDITTGRTKSCGHLVKIKTSKPRKKKEIDVNVKRLRETLNSMKQRCYNENCRGFINYGVRNIKICEEWLNDSNEFIKWAMNNGYDNSLTIDRINVNGNYEPNNCRWITNQEQQNNRRNNVHLTYNGEVKTLAQWERYYGIRQKTITKWISRGWSEDKIFNKLNKIGELKND